MIQSVSKICKKIFTLRKPRRVTILGIETSCDDTGCAVVNSDRKILGECVRSQQEDLIRVGGIMPTLARDWHEKNIAGVVDVALRDANLTVENVDAIAVTVKPGLGMSLVAGMSYAKYLSNEFKKPILPIHHMEAHALTARLLNEEIQYPFLTLLISGGHCILAVAQSVDKFITLGRNTDNAPGEVIDKVARRLKLHNLPNLRKKCGGVAVEEMAKTGNTQAFEFSLPYNHFRHCNFSFSCFRSQVMRMIVKQEEKYGIEADQILPNADDICASFQYCLIKHVVRRMQRGMEFVSMKNLLPENNRTLVVSGGVACNSYFRRAFELLSLSEGYQLYVPPAKYCNDNGVMIAWNGVERFQAGIGIHSHEQLDEINVEQQCLLGEDYNEKILEANIGCNWMTLKELRRNIEKESPNPVRDTEQENDEIKNTKVVNL